MPLKRVLIVEDSIDVGRFYQDTILTAYPGVLTTFTPSAEEAILEASRYNYELLITDVRLPGMSGFDLARKIRLRQPDIRILIITGLSIDPSLRQLSESVKADLLLPKPVGVGDFLAAVENMTGETPRFSAAEVETAGRVPRKKTGGMRRSALDDPRVETQSVPPQKAPTKPLRAGRGAAAPAQEPESSPPLLGALLADLRGSLGALAAILLDDQGRVAAQAGDWPEPGLEEQLVPGLMAGLSSLSKISAQLREGLPAAAHALRGKTFDMAFAPVGRFAVLVFLRSSNSALRLALAFEHLLTVQDQLAQALEGMGLNIRPLPEASLPAPEPQSETQLLPAPAAAPDETEPPSELQPEESASLAALAALLGPNQAVPLTKDANDYWDNLVTGETPSAPSLPTTGELSYEQARKLGLLPEENK
jgi:CheY-like chemotaxis protein